LASSLILAELLDLSPVLDGQGHIISFIILIFLVFCFLLGVRCWPTIPKSPSAPGNAGAVTALVRAGCWRDDAAAPELLPILWRGCLFNLGHLLRTSQAILFLQLALTTAAQNGRQHLLVAVRKVVDNIQSDFYGLGQCFGLESNDEVSLLVLDLFAHPVNLSEEIYVDSLLGWHLVPLSALMKLSFVKDSDHNLQFLCLIVSSNGLIYCSQFFWKAVLGLRLWRHQQLRYQQE